MELKDNPDSSEYNVEVGGKPGEDESREPELLYSITEVPPWYESIFLALQHFLTMYLASLPISLVLAPAICVGEDNVGKAELIATLTFVSGLITLLQMFCGVRLPIVQAGTFALLSPTLSYVALPENKCPDLHMPGMDPPHNESIEVGSPEHKDIWHARLAQIQGSLMVAALLEVLLGFSGTVGFLLRFIGPLTIAPTISLLGISLFKSTAEKAEPQWWICVMSVVLFVAFSQYMGGVKIPCLGYNRDRKFHMMFYPIFKTFPIFIGILISWLICFILTATDTLPKDPDAWGHEARTDYRISVLDESPWVRVPYPGQWGTPTLELSLVVGLFAGLVSSIVESVGDYYATARLSGAPPPPKHAINRGIGLEGVGCIIAGAFGTGTGTTSTSVNVGVIGLTKVGSRRVVVYAAFIMLVLGVFTKFGSLFVTIPDPIVAGSFFVLFGMIVAVGVSNLQFVDMNSSRNLFIFGFSFFCGLTIPEWVSSNPNAIDTGVRDLNNVITVLLSTSMFMGGVIAFILDNTIKGTQKERGLLSSKLPDVEDSKGYSADEQTIYNLPFLMKQIQNAPFTRFLPFCPTYGTKLNKIVAVNEGDTNNVTKVSMMTDNNANNEKKEAENNV